MIQESLLDWKPPSDKFNGSDYVPIRDNAKLGQQITDIFNLMRDGKFRTLQQIENETGHPPASISAQLRHLRKERFGSHTILKNYLGNGLYEYKLEVRK